MSDHVRLARMGTGFVPTRPVDAASVVVALECAHGRSAPSA
jgi:hypothetical protein